MAETTQTYKTHARFFPLFHFFVAPVLLLNFVNAIRHLYLRPSLSTGWAIVVAAALVALALAARLMALGFGTLILFVGVSLNAKRAVRPLAATFGWPGSRFGGTAGTLARENAMRNPSRTASTASALMIGLALITFVAILGAGLRAGFGDAVNKLFVANYAVTASNGFDPFTK